MATSEPARRFTVRSLAAGLLGLSAAAVVAEEPKPAAQLLPPQPVTQASATVVSRAAAPDFTAFDPKRPLSPSMVPGSTVPPAKPAGGTAENGPKPVFNFWNPPPLKPQPAPPQPAAPALAPVPASSESKSIIGEAWTGVKDLVVGKPTPTQPPIAKPADGPPARPPAPTPTPMTTANTGVYAGPPAYRWYGWGTTTPGANPYAPTGHSPNGSANWYAKTGATPGAFPAPVAPRRESQGWEPPAYARVPASTAEAQPASTVLPTTPIGTWPPAPVPSPSMPVGTPKVTPSIPAGRVEAPPANSSGGLIWQPAGGAVQPFGGTISAVPPPTTKPVVNAGHTMVFRGQAPQPATPPTMEELVKEAAAGWAIVEHVKQTGPKSIAVYLATSTEADARVAAEAISKLPQLRPYEVSFQARVR